ncbi:unnamed protein product [Symbiodinium sp. CCMP2456]|nr:unnamed protein product [Symbiodinium sp. CCMP2456]
MTLHQWQSSPVSSTRMRAEEGGGIRSNGRMAEHAMGAGNVSDARMLSALATAVEVSFVQALPSKAHILSRVSHMSGPLLMEVSSQQSQISSLRSHLQKIMFHLNMTESHTK